MKAFQIFKHNKTNLLTTSVDIPRPQPQPHELLIEVKAAGINPLDNMITRGDVKMLTPYAFPLTIGNEGAGVVYVVAPATAVAKMPEGLTFTEAASIPLTALTATQALALMEVKAGQTIFISGGSGGLGAMAIPLAKSRGLTVYTNGNSAARERVLALGADRYLDYKTEDYLEHWPKVDYVLDSLGGAELHRQMKLLKPGGHIVSLRGMPDGDFARRFGLPRWKQWLLSLVGRKLNKEAAKYQASYDFLFVESDGAQLAEVAQLIEQQGIRPTVDRVFPFAETNEALALVARGGASGKVVISLEE